MAAKRKRSARSSEQEATLEMVISGVRGEAPAEEGYVPITLLTNRGEVECRHYSAGSSRCGAIFVGGAGGGWDTPVRGFLYPRLCRELAEDGIACLRVRYRHPAVLDESTLDVLAGIAFLESQGIDAIALTGHSFGGAVVIQAAAHATSVRTCLPLSTQSYGADPAAELSPRCSIFLFHGIDDEILPPSCSQHVYEIAGEPRKLTLHEGGHHGLDEAADVLPQMIRQWISQELTRTRGESCTQR